MTKGRHYRSISGREPDDVGPSRLFGPVLTASQDNALPANVHLRLLPPRLARSGKHSSLTCRALLRS